MSPVEAFVTGIKIIDQWKELDCCLLKLLITWFLTGQRSICSAHSWSFVTFHRLSWSLDWLSKRALITWFNFDPGRNHLHGHTSDYPMSDSYSKDVVRVELHVGLRIAYGWSCMVTNGFCLVPRLHFCFAAAWKMALVNCLLHFFQGSDKSLCISAISDW